MQNTPPNFKALTNRSSSQEGPRFTLPADGFVQLVPHGTAPYKLDDGRRIVQLVDEKATTAMLNRLIEQGGEMLLDYNHENDDLTKRNEAAAWVPLTPQTLQNRADGLYGQPRWTNDGEADVTGGVFRFISPEFSPSKLESAGGNLMRPLALVGVSLVNKPGFRNYAKPLSNREDSTQPNANHHIKTMKPLVAALFGITETELDALDEGALKNRFDGVKTKLASITTLETELTTLKNRAVDEFLAEHKAVIPVGTEDIVKEAFLKNRDSAIALVNGFTGEKKDDKEDAMKQRGSREQVFKNREASTPDGKAEATAAKRASAIKNRAQTLCDTAKAAGRTLNWNDAWTQAESETA